MFGEERILYAIMLVIKNNSHDSNLIDNVLLYVILRMQRSRDAAAAAAATGLGLGASATAAEKVLYSSAVMVRKKLCCLGAVALGAAGGTAAFGC